MTDETIYRISYACRAVPAACRLLCLCACFLCASGCASGAAPVSVVSYADERSVLYEVGQTRLLLEKDPVEALARARGLRDNTSGYAQVEELYSDACARTRAEFDLAVSSGRWSDALALFGSLDVLSLTPAGWSRGKILQNRTLVWKDEGNRTLAELDTIIPSTPEDEAPPSVVAARMIKGTVTVWVDKGMRIENSVGYADRVIGSGFFIDSRGYLITNYHVISSEVDPAYEGYSRLFIKLPADPDTRVPAKVIGWDPILDLALLKTEIAPPAVFQLGSSEDLKVGNRIFAIGSPAGLEQTLTSGIVSAQKRRLLSLGDVLQIDAPINHGNSGGPIIDEAGRVQAVVFAGIEPYEGLNFAIPVEFLRIILPALYAGGKVEHPWLGAFGKSVSSSGIGDGSGALLAYALPGSPCALAGIPEGTVITAFNGTRVATLEELQSLVIREQPRTIVRISGIAPGAESSRDWYPMLSSRPALPGEIALKKDVQSRALLPVTGLRLEQVGNTRKYLVASVLRGSIADESGFSEQDLIEIRDVNPDAKSGAVAIQLYAKKRKQGYLESFIGLTASLDSPSYF